MKNMIILRKLQFEPEQTKNCGGESNQKENKHIHASPANLLHIRIENLHWCKC